MMTPSDYGVTLRYDIYEEETLITEGMAHTLDQLLSSMEEAGPFKNIDLYFRFEGEDVHDGISLDISRNGIFTFYNFDMVRYDFGDNGVCNVEELRSAINVILVPYPSELRQKQVYQRAVKEFLGL